jgi:phage terminase small subunit
MDKRQRRIWREVLADAPHELLGRIDKQLLTNYITVIAKYETAAIAQRKLDQTANLPLLVSGTDHEVISPYVGLMHNCVLLMTRPQGEMGFTPSARASLGATQLARDEPASEHERFDVILPNGERIPYARRGD